MDFQKLLLDVGRALGKDEVKALTFLCTDLLSRNPFSVVSASDLFSRLADQDYLSVERPHLLTELLLIIQRTRLIRDLNLPDQASITVPLISPYRKLLYNLSEEITDNDLNDVKFLLDNKLQRRKLEENSTLEVFLELEHMDYISDTNLDLLETIIDSVRPILKDKIKHFKELQVTQSSLVAQETGRVRSVSCPLEPTQAPQIGPERNASCEMSDEIRPLVEFNMSSSNTSVDHPPVFHGGDEGEGLSRGLSDLNTETSSFAPLKVRNPALETSQENTASSEEQTSQMTYTNNDVLEPYPMTAAKRGICLIVNNYDFTGSIQGLPKREGTKFDEESLRHAFKWLGFEIVIKRECKREDMLSVLRDLGRRNHSQMDCLVCCILSHGNEGSVYGVDGLTVQIKELKEPVNGSKCASLAEKPKLFFIQACQGTSQQGAVYVSSDGPACSRVCSDAVKAKSIPSDADFLLAMATVPSYVSYREKSKGTWFIQSLCQNLVQMVPRGCDLVSILTKVNADVSQKTDFTGVKKQMPQPAFSLTKKVVFPIPKAPPPSLSHR